MLKKTSALVAVLLCLSLLCSCNFQKTKAEKNHYYDYDREFINTSTQIFSTQNNKYDKLLASGYDKDNNYFELVATETEDYSGTTIKIGVLKNGEWSIPLTTDSPFINESGLLTWENSSIYDNTGADFHYIGNGCFYYARQIWNGYNGLYFDEYNKTSWYEPVVRVTGNVLGANSYSWIENKTIVNNDGLIILESFHENYKLLDTNTMETTDIDLIFGNGIDYCFPYSEGLFACMNDNRDAESNGFYDINGNKVIDLSCYTLAENTSNQDGGLAIPKERLVFENGKCTFKITNDQGTYYDITIDKTGKVLSYS